MTKAYYWKSVHHPNFGDLLTPYLVNHFSETTVEWAAPAEADVISTGSVLDMIPDGWAGIVAGSGKRLSETATDLTRANVLGVRGKLTEQDVILPFGCHPVLGDPALLAAEMVPAERNQHVFGVVPHWSDRELYQRELTASKRYKYDEPILIDVKKDPYEVIRQIAGCTKIAGSSLHAIVIADAFGIPRRTEKFPNMDKRWEGGQYKFDDYNSAIGMDTEFGKMQAPEWVSVERAIKRLFDMMCELGDLLNA